MKKIKWLFAATLVVIALVVGNKMTYASESIFETEMEFETAYGTEIQMGTETEIETESETESEYSTQMNGETFKRYMVLLGQMLVEISQEEVPELDELETNGDYIEIDGNISNNIGSTTGSVGDVVISQIEPANLQTQVDNHINNIVIEETSSLDSTMNHFFIEDVAGGKVKDIIKYFGKKEIKDELAEVLDSKYLGALGAEVFDQAFFVTDVISADLKFLKTALSTMNDPDGALKSIVSFGDTVASLTGGNIIWNTNSKLWNYLFETQEYKQFVEENKDNFGTAFWQATWEGWKECAADIPREVGNIMGNTYQAIENFGNAIDSFIDRLINQNKPTEEVNVYKPNIYFYADAPLKVQVEFLRAYLLTETIPEYSYGWDSVVHGDGTLTCQGETYDFLFYESLASRELVEKETGWIIYADTREEQLLEVLALYDFNEKETADFMEFWMEMLEDGVDYVMYPQDTVCVDVQMPIEITPAPTQMTRIWFGFETYNGQEIDTPEVEPIQRDGFTVVEWGGFILDEKNIKAIN